MSKRLLTAACLLLLSGCSTQYAHEQRGPTTLPNALSCDQCAEPTELCSGVFVRASTNKEGGFDLSCNYEGVRYQFYTPRNCEVFADTGIPGILIIRDAYASNEDRLILLRMTGGKSIASTVDHVDAGADGYLHSHYRIVSLQDGVASVEEYQYAGAGGPRHRFLRINLARAQEPSFSGWTRGE
jgi:hypothetical protein